MVLKIYDKIDYCEQNQAWVLTREPAIQWPEMLILKITWEKYLCLGNPAVNHKYLNV